MQNTLYPLIYKPGIKRDGTLFQAEYCIKAQWCRFQRGTIRKIGGMKGVNNTTINSKLTTSHIRILPSTNSTEMVVYTANGEGGIYSSVINQNFSITQGPTQQGNFNTPNKIFKSEVIIQGNNKQIVFLASDNLDNINSTSNANLYSGNINAPLNNIAKPPVLTGLSGLLYASNYLFVYGANGLVQWSKLKNPTDFTNPADRSINISNDMIVDARAIRGGTNSPAILFWTLSSVIKCLNTPDSGGNLQFQVDVISEDSSILSTRCVVEYRGVFFWPGTDRFFQYNGIVDDLANPINLNFFYDNLDMSRRQQVVGVKNTKYGEIWWFYPEKEDSPFRDINIPKGQNSRALIYNVKENAWYDTQISRSTAFYSRDFGFMASYGCSLTEPSNTNGISLYRHEYEFLTPNPNIITEFVPNGNDFTINPIPSTFTSPVFSWAAFNPMKQLTGTDRWIQLLTIEPDFLLLSENPDLKVIINMQQYAQNAITSSTPFNVPPLNLAPINAINAKIDINLQSRHMSLTFITTASHFEMGHVMLSLGTGDGK